VYLHVQVGALHRGTQTYERGSRWDDALRDDCY
jgi:hypothetical protein